jgi:hypothetical protein
MEWVSSSTGKTMELATPTLIQSMEKHLSLAMRKVRFGILSSAQSRPVTRSAELIPVDTSCANSRKYMSFSDLKRANFQCYFGATS